MKIGLLDVDGHNFPNLAQMKLSAYHKSIGDTVEKYMAIDHYDLVYKSKVFTFSPDIDVINSDSVIQGGTGYGLTDKLPSYIEHTMPDYLLYGITDTAYGFLSRGCPRACSFCIVSEKEGRKSVKVADLSEWWSGQKVIKLLDPNTLACKDSEDLLKQLAESKALIDFTQGVDARLLSNDNIKLLNGCKIKMIHFAWDFMSQSDAVIKGLELYAAKGKIQGYRERQVYVLINYGTTLKDNLYRIYKLRDMNYNPYIMVYDKERAPKESLDLQRWVNNRKIWNKCKTFDEYKKVVKS